MGVNQDFIKTTLNQTKLNETDKPLDISKDLPLNLVDDDEEKKENKENFEINNFAFKEFVEEFNEYHPDYFDNEMYQSIYEQMIEQQLEFITYPEGQRQAVYMQERIEQGSIIGDYATYFVNGIKRKRTSKVTVLKERKFKKGIEETKEKKELQEKTRAKNSVPIYNWLES